MTDEVVLAFTPSDYMKDWMITADGNHEWYYTPRVRHYCMAHKEIGDTGGFDDCSRRKVGQEPHFDLSTGEIVPKPKLCMKRYPKKGEWEHLKTVEDVKNSPLYKGEL
jgi:hypothetical protein